MSKRTGRDSAALKSVEAEHRLFGQLALPRVSTFTQGSVAVKDLALGAGAGLAGVAGLRYLVNNYLADKLPAIAVQALNMPAVAGLLTGVGLYVAQKGSQKAKAHLIGATVAGAAAQAWTQLQTQFNGLQDYVSVGLDGMLVEDGYRGVLVEDSRSNLAELQAINLGSEEYDAV
jgi:hypothetical protein